MYVSHWKQQYQCAAIIICYVYYVAKRWLFVHSVENLNLFRYKTAKRIRPLMWLSYHDTIASSYTALTTTLFGFLNALRVAILAQSVAFYSADRALPFAFFWCVTSCTTAAVDSMLLYLFLYFIVLQKHNEYYLTFRICYLNHANTAVPSIRYSDILILKVSCVFVAE